MPKSVLCVAFDQIGSRDEYIAPQTLAALRDDDQDGVWLPFRLCRGDEIWAMLTPEALSRFACKLLSSGRWRVAVGLGYAQVNSAFFPRDYAADAAEAALKEKRDVSVRGPRRARVVASALERALLAGDEDAIVAAAVAAAQAGAGFRPRRAFGKLYL